MKAFIVMLLIVNVSCSQKKIYFKLDTFIISNKNISENDDSKYFIANNKMYYYIENVKYKFIIYDEFDSINIKISAKYLTNKRVKSVIMNDDFLFVHTYKKVYIFLNQDNKFQFNDSINHNYRNISMLNDTSLLFWSNYNSHPLDCPPNERTKFGVFDIKKRVFKKKINEKFNYYYYTHLMSKFISVSPNGEMISLSQTSPYKIYFYDLNLNKIKSINPNVNLKSTNLDAIDRYMDTIRNINWSIKHVIKKASINDKNIDRIVKTYFLDDSTFLVIKKFSYSNKNKYERNIDVWRLVNDNWELLVNNQKYFSHSFYKKKITYEFHLPFLYSNQLFINNGYIYLKFRDIPFDSIKGYDKLMNYFNETSLENSFNTLYKFKYEIK